MKHGGIEPIRRAVTLPMGDARLPGDLVVPSDARAIVLFAHGSGSSRRSSRNVAVADRLHEARLATLLFDLLTDEESRDRALVFDIGLLAGRLASAAAQVSRWSETTRLPPSFFGASTGAAAALVAAAGMPGEVAAVVSRGGRPDLAREALERVTAPTLLIVGGADLQVLDLNREARHRLRAESSLEVVPGAGHLFEEPGALERVAELAASWIVAHIGSEPEASTGR